MIGDGPELFRDFDVPDPDPVASPPDVSPTDASSTSTEFVHKRFSIDFGEGALPASRINRMEGSCHESEHWHVPGGIVTNGRRFRDDAENEKRPEKDRGPSACRDPPRPRTESFGVQGDSAVVAKLAVAKHVLIVVEGTRQGRCDARPGMAREKLTGQTIPRGSARCRHQASGRPEFPKSKHCLHIQD